MLKNLANTAVNFSLPVTCAVRYEVLLIRLESRLTREDFFFSLLTTVSYLFTYN